MYAEEVAATTIQAAYRGFQTRKSITQEHHAAQVIQKAYRKSHEGKSRSQIYQEAQPSESHLSDQEVDYTRLEDDRLVKKKFPFANKIRKSVTNVFRRASMQVQDSENLSKIRRNSIAMKGRGGNIRSPSPEIDDYSPPPWIPEITGSDDALAGTVINRSMSDVGAPGWTSSLDTLTSTVVIMTNNVCPPLSPKEEQDKEKVSEQKRGFPFLSDEEESLDSILAKERDYHSLAKRYQSEQHGEMYRSIVVTGGFNAHNTDDPESGKLVLSYDPASDQWSGIGLMPKPRHHHRTVYLNDFIYIIGGCHPAVTKGGKMVPLRSCYSFNLTTKEWNKLPKMRHARMYHGAAALKEKIYVIGGKKENDIMLDSIEVYCPSTNTWTEIDPLDYPTMGAGVCTFRGQVWVIGGMLEKRGKISLTQECKSYDPEIKEWNWNIQNLPYPRAFIGAVECMNRVFVIGGTSYADSDIYSDALNSLEEVIYFEQEDGTWKTITSMTDPRHFVAAAAIGRSLFVLGGLTSCRAEAIVEVNMLTETDDQWHKCSNLPTSLCGFAAVAIPKVLG
ncbi:BTB domain-containing protein [Nephila pilipes]|uniref:BTB domain-containing protein n=1 Tax=Nephila pilipes TaxID=299642 RepID=A0A8X6TF96_NEPPI|nr:BTB domain-containing protein [Nephila pilipes]